LIADMDPHDANEVASALAEVGLTSGSKASDYWSLTAEHGKALFSALRKIATAGSKRRTEAAKAARPPAPAAAPLPNPDDPGDQTDIPW
jgi:hypothetical protein